MGQMLQELGWVQGEEGLERSIWSRSRHRTFPEEREGEGKKDLLKSEDLRVEALGPAQEEGG